jgi:hypothetical protein
MGIVLQTVHWTSSNRLFGSFSCISFRNKEICITLYVVLSQTIMSVRFVYLRTRSHIQCYVNFCNVHSHIFESG